MVGQQTLSPGEVAVLLDPNGAKARDALKITVLSLVAQGALRIEQRISKGMFNREKRQTVLNLAPSAPAPSSGPAGAVLEALAPIAPDGEPMPGVVSRLQKRFGQDLSRFVTECVRPALVARGLLEARREKTLWIIPVTRYRPTPAGEAEQSRLQGLMRQAREIPDLLGRNPAQAAALFAALGASVLLIEELRPYLPQLAELMKSLSLEGALADMDFDFSSSGDATGAFDMGGLDVSALDSLDQSLADFDASFDAGDSGGGDTGGDSGGGGD